MASSITETLPLQSRTVRSHGKAPASVPFVSQHPHNYRGYDSMKMEKAYEAVKSGKMSVRRAAEEYGVPRSTLHDKTSGKVNLKAKSGGGFKRHLTDEEEFSLVEFLIECASIGYATSRRDVIAIAQQIARVRDPQAEITRGWWDSFRRRHPEISLRQAEPLSYARAAANNPEVIDKYFDSLEEIIEVNGLSKRPGQIFNCDKTGMPLVHKPPKVVTSVGQKHPYAITSGDKTQITVLACASASGYSIPPMVIFDRKTIREDMIEGELPQTFYGLSDSGWMDTELFAEWFKFHFLRHAPSSRPLLLLLDGHTSHCNPSILRVALDEGVIIFCLPPHTTHLLQPLDNGVLSSLKDHWRKECQQFYAKNPGKVLNRHNFMQVFRPAWMKGLSMSNIMGCFRATGVYPVDRKVVQQQLTQETDDQRPFCKASRDLVNRFTPVASNSITFTSPEVRAFEKCLRESKDERYALWLETFYPQSTAVRQSAIDVILKRPTPPAQHKQHFQQGARVLTSETFIREAEEKAERKRKKEEEKEKKKEERERKRQEKAERDKEQQQEKEKKREERERKRREKTEKDREQQQEKEKKKEEQERKRQEKAEQRRHTHKGIVNITFKAYCTRFS